MPNQQSSMNLLPPGQLGLWVAERLDIWQMRFLGDRDLGSFADRRGLSLGFDHVQRLWQLGLLRADLVASKGVCEIGYDPERHHRRSIRLHGWDYTQPGAYFVTICTHNGECLFEDPVLRQVVETMWQRLPRHFPRVRLDEFVVMPNHIHGIIWIVDDNVGARHSRKTPSLTGTIPSDEATQSREQPSGNASPLPPRRVVSGSLGAIVGNLKSLTTRRINRIRGTPRAPVWQRNYYEHIIRNEDELSRIQEYIRLNPLKWELDRENPNRTGRNPEEDWLYGQRKPTTFHHPRPH